MRFFKSIFKWISFDVPIPYALTFKLLCKVIYVNEVKVLNQKAFTNKIDKWSRIRLAVLYVGYELYKKGFAYKNLYEIFFGYSQKLSTKSCEET